MTDDNAKVVTIFGTSKAKPGDDVFTFAQELGTLCAQQAFTVANGGYGGTMLASAKGAAKAGGKVIGVTCSDFGRSGPNEYITEEIRTDSLEKRLETLIELGDAYIVLPGGTGTLLELAHVWELKNKGLAYKQKPIIIIKAFWKGLINLMTEIDPGTIDSIALADSPDEVMKILNKPGTVTC